MTTPVQVDDPRHRTSVSQRFFSNAILNFAGQGFLLVLTFATAPYIVHHLGAELFGIVALVQTIAGFAGILNLGIARALTKYVSELYWKGDIHSINRLFQTAWATCIASGLLGFLLIAGPKNAIGRIFFRGGPEVNHVIGFAIYVAAFGLFTSMLLEGISAIPGALQRFDVCNKVNVASGAVRYLGSVAVLALGYSVRSVLMVNLLANVLAVAIFALVSQHMIKGLKLVPTFHWASFKRLFSFSLPLFLAAISALVVTRLDRLILAYFLPLAAVTFYTLPYSLSEKAAMSVANITSVVFPFTSELHAMGSRDKVHELYLRSAKVLTLVTLPFSVILVAMPGPILRYWVGPEYAAQGAVVLSVLGIATFVNAVSAVPTVTALGVGRAWIPAGFALGSSVINVASNIILIPRYGINGAAVAVLLAQALITPAFVFVVTRMLHVSIWRFLSETFLRPMTCAGFQFAVLLLFRSYVTNLINLLLLCVASLGIYAALSLFGVISQEERTALFRVPRKTIPGIDAPA
jgi:O-antigen/teichoic acid export membrane protein